ncbi:AAA family ATPase, partial [Lysinibacillus sp. CNPSo 3705]|uniref:ParA family protein n=1 Tax=Lysinibacillus sp. CNPSo 3705 TaxID=3028148 RepID=UPI00236400CB
RQDRYSIINYKNIDLIASHQDLIYTDMDIASFSRPNYQNNLLNKESYKFKFLKNIIENLIESHKYDYVIIDCPPNLNFITQNALYASDYYIIPTILDKLSTYGILSITNKVKELNKIFSALDDDYTKTELLGIIANNVVERKGEPKYSQSNRLTTLKGTFGNEVFENYLTYGDGIATSSASGFPVYGVKSENANKQSDLMLDILIEMLTRMEKL